MTLRIHVNIYIATLWCLEIVAEAPKDRTLFWGKAFLKRQKNSMWVDRSNYCQVHNWSSLWMIVQNYSHGCVYKMYQCLWVILRMHGNIYIVTLWCLAIVVDAPKDKTLFLGKAFLKRQKSKINEEIAFSKKLFPKTMFCL